MNSQINLIVDAYISEEVICFSLEYIKKTKTSVTKKIFKNKIDTLKYFVIMVNKNIIVFNYVDSVLNLISNNRKFCYTLTHNPKNDLASIIIKHMKSDCIYNFIKNKILLLKQYFIDIQDVYKVILRIMNDVYSNDKNIILEIFFEEDMEIYCEKYELTKL